IPIFSLSLREFWGQRYNRWVGTIFKESIFEPIRSEFSSSTIGGLTTFIVSGLFHVHAAYVTFGDISTLFPSFMFFFLHGIGCFLEAKVKIQFSQHVGWLLTHAFLLITAQLQVAPFIENSVIKQNPSPFYNVGWIPKLPIPNFCPR
ncbi:unnamed protein product, partial [Rotaria sp. Silwood1]